MEKGVVPSGSLLEEVDTRVFADSSEKIKLGERRNVQIGDLVLIAEDNVLRNRWPMGRVMEVFCGEDGGVRSVKIKTASSVFHRPVTKLCLLEEGS